jgi:hypothetical protein
MTDEEQRLLQAQQDMLVAEHLKEVGEISEIGRTVLGREEWDNAEQTVTAALGSPERIGAFAGALRGMDKPVEILSHLANNPTRLAEFSKLPPQRQLVEMSRIEAEHSSYGNVRTGRAPQWKNPEVRSGRVSDEEWARTGGSALDDSRWNREFDRRMAERSEKKFGRVVRGPRR